MSSVFLVGTWARGSAVAAEPPVPTRDPATARDLADDILSEPRYDEPARPLAERVLGWFADRIADAFSVVAAGGGASVVVAIVVVAALAYGLVRLVRSMRGLRLDRPLARAGAEVEVVAPRRTAAEWRRSAAELAAAGRWREALRDRYRAVVADLEAAGVLVERPGTTTGEHRTAVTAAAPRVSDGFARAVELFDVVYYGGREAGPGELDRFGEIDTELAGELRR